MKLKEIASVRSGLVLSRKQCDNTEDSIYKYKQLNLRSIISTGYIDLSELDDYSASEKLKWEYLTHKGDLIIRLSNPYTAILIDDFEKGLVIPSHFVIIRANLEHILPEYLFWLLNTDKIKKNIIQNNSSNMIGAIKPSFFSELEIDMLPLNKQRVIANINLAGKNEIDLLVKLSEQKQIYYKELTNKIQKEMRREVNNDNKR